MEEKVLLVDVEYGRNEYWLKFTGFVPRCDNSRKYKFEYCGTELHTTAGMSDKAKDDLLAYLNRDFGYPPFDLERAKGLVESNGEYYVKIK